MALTFKKAKRSLARLRLALQGTRGSGKTYSALLLAKGLGGKIAVIDTERSSASLYADLPEMPDFATLDLEPPYSPERYVEAIKAADEAGYDVRIIDSITHEWSGQGGCLELNDQLARTRFRGNTWSAWSETTPRHRRFVDAMLASRCHIIATMRTKAAIVQEEGDRGRKTMKKVSDKAEQRDGMDFEFTIVFDLDAIDHLATASKDRSSLFKDPVQLSEEVGKKIAAWLSTTQPEPKPEPQPVATAKYEELAEKLYAADNRAQLSEAASAIAAAGVTGEERDRLLAIYRQKKQEFTELEAIASEGN